MLAIVRIALDKPYTFVVMAMLIVIFGVTAAIRRQQTFSRTSAFPSSPSCGPTTDCPPTTCQNRVIYYYERTLSSQVNDIEHIESQSLPRYGIVKVFFQPGVNINGALAQIDRGLADRSEIAAAGHYPALRSQLQRIERARHSTGAVQPGALSGAALRRGPELHPASTRAGRRIGNSLALRRQASAGPSRHRSAEAASLRAVGAGRRRARSASRTS